MKLKLFVFVLLGIILFRCSQQSTPTDVPVAATIMPSVTANPTITKTLPTSTPMPTTTPIPTATEIVPGSVLFEEDFEDGKADNFVYISNGWLVTTEDNGNKVFEINTNTELAIKNEVGAGVGFGSKDWSNYSAEYRVKLLNSQGNTWMNFRSTIGDNQTYYVEWLSGEWNTITLHINQNFGPWVTLQHLDNRVWDGRWYQVRIEADGPRLRVYLNDNLMLQADDDRITHGGFDLGVTSGTHALFDDIRVTALAP